jgi:hypothetical protein
MAATSIGLSSVAFGLAAETGVVIQSFSLTSTAETTEVSKHNGEHSAVAFSAFKRNVSLSGNCSGAVASSGIGGTLALTGNTAAVSSGTYYVTDVSFSQAADGFNSFDLSATAYTGLSST